MRQVGHPTVVLIGNVERNFGGRAGPVDEQRHAVGRGPAAQDGGRLHYFPNIDLGGLSRNGGNRGLNLDIVIDAQQMAAVVSKCGGAERGGREPKGEKYS